MDLPQLKLLLSHILLNQLEISPKKQSLLFLDAPGFGYGSNGDRASLMTWTFEKLGCKSCMFMPQPVAGAFATGRTTAVVVDSGFESSSVTSVVDGRMEQKNVLRIDHASQETAMLEMLLANERISTTEGEGLPTVDQVGNSCRQVAEGICYCTLKPLHKELNAAKAGRTKRKYQLPDGTWLPVSEERFLIPEVLFGSNFGNRWNCGGGGGGGGGGGDFNGFLGSGGLGGAVAYQLKQQQATCSQDTYVDLSQNIVCIGGRSETENFDERLDLEIGKALGLLPRKKKSLEDDDASDVEKDDNNVVGEQKEHTPKRPKMARNKQRSKKTPRTNAAWAGGSMIATIDAMRSLWITKAEFDELGAEACVDRRRMS